MGKTAIPSPVQGQGDGSERGNREGAGREGGRISRRTCLKALTAVGSAALACGSGKAHAYREFPGWPDRFGMLVDLTECVGCRSCEAACNRANGLPAPEIPFDLMPLVEKLADFYHIIVGQIVAQIVRQVIAEIVVTVVGRAVVAVGGHGRPSGWVETEACRSSLRLAREQDLAGIAPVLC